MADIIEFSNPWYYILGKYRKKQRIEIQQVMAALESEYPIIDEAKPFLAAILRRAHKLDGEKYRFKTGNKNRHPITGSKVMQNLAAEMVNALEESLEKTPDGTPREQAKAQVANGLGISIRELEKYL